MGTYPVLNIPTWDIFKKMAHALTVGSVVTAMSVPGYERDKLGEVISFMGPTSVGEGDKLLRYTELFCRSCTNWSLQQKHMSS